MINPTRGTIGMLLSGTRTIGRTIASTERFQIERGYWQMTWELIPKLLYRGDVDVSRGFLVAPDCERSGVLGFMAVRTEER